MTHLTSDAETLLSSEHSPHGNYDPGKTVRNGTHIQNERFLHSYGKYLEQITTASRTPPQ